MYLYELLAFLGFTPETITVRIGNSEPFEIRSGEKVLDFVYEHDNYIVIECKASAPNKTATVSIRKWCENG